MERDPITAAWALIIISLFIFALCWEILYGVVESIQAAGRSIRAWWRNRRPAKGWQPGDHPRGPRPWKGIRWPR